MGEANGWHGAVSSVFRKPGKVMENTEFKGN